MGGGGCKGRGGCWGAEKPAVRLLQLDLEEKSRLSRNPEESKPTMGVADFGDFGPVLPVEGVVEAAWFGWELSGSRHGSDTVTCASLTVPVHG